MGLARWGCRIAKCDIPEAGGMSFTQLVDELIQLALKKQRDKEKLSFSFDTNLLATASLPTGGAKGAKA